MPLSQLLAPWVTLAAPAHGQANPTVRNLALDSRRIATDGLFLACQGERTHGLASLDQALAQGAAAVAYEPSPGIEPPVAPPGHRHVPLIAVEGLRHKASAIAARFFDEPSRDLRVVGVTGTDGKTSVTTFIARALERAGGAAGVIGTLGHGRLDALEPTEHTTPDPVSLQQCLAETRARGAHYVAMEVSSHALAQGRTHAVPFAVAALTNVTRDHLDYHGSLENYRAAKARLFEDNATADLVLNLDDGLGASLARKLGTTRRIWGYHVNRGAASVSLGAGCTHCIFAEGVELRQHGLTTTIREGEEAVRIDVPLFGAFQVGNLLATFSTLRALGLGFHDAGRAIAGLDTVDGRMERLPKSVNAPTVLVDYAHTPEALSQALSAARAHTGGRLICVFGCGGERDRGKRPLMGQVAEAHADHVIVTDDNPRSEPPADIVADILSGLEQPGRATVIQPRSHAIATAIAQAGADDLVLLAGKGHERYQEMMGIRHPFSDSDEARRALEERR